MITYQDVRRNMCDAEKLYANDKVSARRIIEENERKKLAGNKLGADITNGKAISVQMDAERNQSRDRSTNTREQRARHSGVSAGTVARYDTVMNSNDDEQLSSVKHRTKWIERRKNVDFKRFSGSLLLEIRLLNDKFCWIFG